MLKAALEEAKRAAGQQDELAEKDQALADPAAAAVQVAALLKEVEVLRKADDEAELDWLQQELATSASLSNKVEMLKTALADAQQPSDEGSKAELDRLRKELAEAHLSAALAEASKVQEDQATKELKAAVAEAETLVEQQQKEIQHLQKKLAVSASLSQEVEMLKTALIEAAAKQKAVADLAAERRVEPFGGAVPV